MKRILVILILLISKLAYPIEQYWYANEKAFEHSMNVTATIYVDNEEQQNEMLELAAFCGKELRGSALPDVSIVTDKLVYSLTVYGNEDNEPLTFKLYDHSANKESELICSQTLEFRINGIIGDAITPYIVCFKEPTPCFTGNGSWNESSNWENSKKPTAETDAIIDGDAVINGNVTVNSLVINEGKSLTIENGAVLTVNGTLTNTDVNALVLEEGGQIFQNSDNVAATFRNNIENPTGNWGEEDKTGWQFVASPVSNANVNGFIPASGDYDLYMYDGTKEQQWVNFKQLGSVSYDFSSNPFNNGWTSIDADGDGNDWTYQSRSKYMYSVTYNDMLGDIYAENYFVSPKISISDGTMLSFKVRCTNNEFYPETFKILLSEGSNTHPDDFNIEVENYIIENTSFQTYTYDLSKYAGKDVYVAFYHYVAPENFGSEQLIIDDVEFINENYFESGRGYLVSYQSESVSDFKGELNNEPSYKIKTNAYSSSDNLANFSLLGNPYPFDIDWKANVAVEGVYDGYAMVDSKDGSYKYYTDGFIRTGEGFMVKSVDGSNNEVTISKTKTRSLAEDSYINIVSTGKNGSDNLIIRFGENENGGFQKMENFNKGVALLYVNDDKYSYGIYSYSNDVTEIPVHFEAKEMGTYTLTFDIQGEFESLYLLDKATGVSVNMLLEKEYSFMANANDLTSRFVITTNVGTTPDSVQNFVYVSNSELIVNDINGNAAINIYDVLGRCVYETNCTDAMNHISMEVFNAGAYIIQKIDDKGVRTQKFVFNR
ncbi:MAG: choice-of-anchor J domain-containing protein [Bacteroidales bacterium]|nr:choice-of-anchor J domain-containing protein [Bacteroidales bacterium]